MNYNIQTKTVTEWNVGCEKCHGPGGDHIKQSRATNVLNPARMDYVKANDACIQCHSQGQLGIPAKVNAHSEGKMNSIPG